MSVIVYQPPGRPWGSPNFSPFCTKLETYLRMTGIEHEVRAGDPRRAPKGKIPYASIDGEILGDSELILEQLRRTRGDALDAQLTDRERALGHAVRRMLEEGTYFVSMYQRWHDDRGYEVLYPAFSALLPAALRVLVMPLIRGRARSTLRLQGTGRHSAEEVYAIGRRDLDALSTLLADQPYLLGDRPSSYDATVYAFAEGILSFPYDSPMRAHARGKANLVAYRARMRARWFPELAPA